MNQSLYALIENRFPADSSRILIETDDGAAYSWRDLDTLTARYARLMSDLGLAKGDRVAVQTDKSPQAMFLYLACLRGGFIFLPMNTAYQHDEVDYLVGNAEPRLIVCRPEVEATTKGIAAAHGCLNVLTMDGDGRGSFAAAAQAVPADFSTVDCAADDVACILYTSGTTGRPKGAMLTHRNLSSNALALVSYWGITAGDVLLHALPIFHAHGLFVACNTTLLAGARMLWLARFDGDRVLDLLPRATTFMGVPTFYTRLLASPRLTRDACRHMRLFVSGSAPLLEETFRAFEERTGFAILERYGMTETGMNTSNPLTGERRPGTVGFPLPGVSVRAVGDDGSVLGTDGVGVLQVKGPNVFAGYWRMPEKTSEDFTADGWFKTGDVGKVDTDGYVHIVGRAKDLIISGGYNVYPKEVESVVDRIDGVVESAVIGVPHPDFGEAVTAVVKRLPGRTDVTEAAVIAVVKTRIANYKVPKTVHFVEELPRNAMGKVQKNVLREMFSSRASSLIG